MKYQARIIRTIKEADDVTTLFFNIDDGLYEYVAGQYIAVYVVVNGVAYAKAYSLSSAPDEPEGSITVKNIGTVSGYLCGLQPGDELCISSPFGFFNAQNDAPIVAIASGVGIAPIWSIIKDEMKYNPDRSITLFHTAKTRDGLIFQEQLKRISAENPSLRNVYFVTQQPADGCMQRRFSVAEDITPDMITAALFYVCGSETFVRDMWRQLMAAGIDEQRVVTETFFESAT